MKRIWISLIALVAMGAVAQKPDVQSGTPATLEAINGKQARVFLQRLENGKLTFQPNKSSQNITVPASKIKSLTFYPKYDAETVEQQFNAGEYSAVLSTLGPLMDSFWDYMVVDNNLRDAFCMLMDAYYKSGKFPEARKVANILLESDDPGLVQRGQANIALIAIAENDLETARKIRREVTSEAAGLYLQACIERAEQRPKVAIWTASGIILNHANDLEWLGPSELLCANLYADMLGSNPVITTNSPLHTARQVKNIYLGSSVAADAEKLWVRLGGAEREAAIAAEKAELEKEEAEKIAKREAEEKAKLEAEEKAKKEADAASLAEDAASTNNVGAAQSENAASTNDVNATVEMESE